MPDCRSGSASSAARQPVEPHHVGQHGEEGGPDRVAALGEDGRERRAAPFEAAAQVGEAEAHFARVRRHPQVGEQASEEGIGPLVVDEEAGVGGDRAAGKVDHHGVGVTAGPVVGLEDVDLVVILEQVGRRHAGDAGPDDADAQGGPPAMNLALN